MRNTRKTSHTRYDHKNHIIFCTKYRKPVLTGEVGLRFRDITRQVCERNNVEIIRGNVRKDHVHLLLSIPPYKSISKIIQYIKGTSSRKLQMEFRHLGKQYWGRHFWAIGYFSATAGTVTDETIADYIENQGDMEEDKLFRVGY